MGLVMLVSSLLVIGSMIFLATKFSDKWLMLWFVLILPILVPLCVNFYRAIPTEEFKYEASVTLPGNSQGNHTTIYFDEFEQSGSKIIIEDFSTRALHFGDFGNTDKSARTLIITLSDNNGRFIYTDRVKNKTFDDNIIATQP